MNIHVSTGLVRYDEIINKYLSVNIVDAIEDADVVITTQEFLLELPQDIPIVLLTTNAEDIKEYANVVDISPLPVTYDNLINLSYTLQRLAK